MKKILSWIILAVSLAPLAGCVVYEPGYGGYSSGYGGEYSYGNAYRYPYAYRAYPYGYYYPHRYYGYRY